MRFDLLKNGYDLSCFHAHRDRLKHKRDVVRTLVQFSNWQWAASVIEMAKVHPSIREPQKFYPKFAAAPLRFVLRGRASQATKLLIYTDQLQVNKESVKKAIRLTCSAELPEGLSYCLYHHPSSSNAWLQVADYCAYAVYRKWVCRDSSLYEVLAKNLACEEMDLLRNGDQTYYRHSSLP